MKARTGGSPAAPEPPLRALAPAPAVPVDDPEPQVEKYDEYGAYIRDLSRWTARQEHRTWEAAQETKRQQEAAERERQRLTTSWTERVNAAKQRYPDFEAVALQGDTAIPPGSLIDAWILEHKTGADVLYYLQQHPDELDTLLSQSVLDQAEGLALLSQRFNGHSPRTAAAATGSAPASTTPPPKPPNPVRTGPIKTGDDPPDDEHASIADHERYWKPRRLRGSA